MKRKGNKVVADNWDWVEVDVSSPRHPEGTIKLDTEDWEYLSGLQEDGSLGRIFLSDFYTFGRFYPAARLRGKQRSLLTILFRSRGGVKCTGDDWTDLRRSNLEWSGNGPLRNLGSTEWSKQAPLTKERVDEFNNEVDLSGPHVILMAEHKDGPHQITMDHVDLAILKAKAKGAVYMKKSKGGSLIPYCKFVENRKVKRQALVWAIHEGTMKYATDNFTDIRAENLAPRKKPKNKGE